MVSNNYNPNDEVQSGVDRQLDKGKEKLQKQAKKQSKKLAQKSAKAVLKLVKQIVTTVVNVVAATWPVLVGVLASLFLILMFKNAFDIINDAKTKNQAYDELRDEESSNYNFKVGETTSDSLISGTVYNDFSSKSYYITIEDEKGNPIENGKIWQAGTTEWEEFSKANNVVDIDGREDQFALSSEMLAVLDSSLNDSVVYPEQFIRPVYTDCLTGEQTNFSECQLLDLVDEDGAITSRSHYYALRPDTSTKGSLANETEVLNADTPSASERASEGTILYDLDSDSKTAGVWDWGLASIIHYKRFQQDSKVDNYRIKTFTKWDEETKQLVTDVTWDSLTKKERDAAVERYGIVVPNVSFTTSSQDKANSGVEYTYTKEEAENYKQLTNSNAPVERLYPAIPETEVKHAITGAVTYLGSINNKPYQAFINQGETTSTAIVLDHEEKYSGLTEAELRANDFKPDPKGNKVIRLFLNGGQIAEINESNPHIQYVKDKVVGQDEKCVAEAQSNLNKPSTPGGVVGNTDVSTCVIKESGYEFGGGWYVGEQGSFTFERAYFMDIEYEKSGNLFTNTVIYAAAEPDTSNIVGFEYLENYINNYRAFIPVNPALSRYKCYDASDLYVNTFLNTEIFNIDNLENRNIGIFGQCKSSEMAIEYNGYGYMSSNYLSELSESQYYAIIQKLGLSSNYINQDANNEGSSYFSLESYVVEDNGIANAINNSTGDFIKIESEYGKDIKKIAIEYGISYPLLLAIAKQESGGDHQGNISQEKCNSGCGLMQIENPVGNPRAITAYNFNKREDVTLEINYENMKDPLKNVQAAAMLLQNLLIEYEYNTLLSIQAYNFGSGAVDQCIELYSKESGFDRHAILQNITDIGWTKYRKEIYTNPSKYIEGASATGTWGDYQYLEHVLRYTGSTPFRFQNATNDPAKRHSVVTFIPTHLVEMSILNTSKINANEVRLKNAYTAYKQSQQKEQTLALITRGQKNLLSGVYELDSSQGNIKEGWLNLTKNKGYLASNFWDDQLANVAYTDVIRNEFTSDMSTTDIIAMMFAFDQGTTIDMVKMESEEVWKGRFAKLFSSTGSKKWTSSVDMSDYVDIENGVRILQENYSVKKHFGYVKNSEAEDYEYNKETLILAKPLITQVFSFNNGTVVDIQKTSKIGFTGSSVTVAYQTGSKPENTVEVIYDYLENINVTNGQEVKTGDEIGKTGIDGYVGITFRINEVENDAEVLIKALEDSWSYKVGEADGFIGLYGSSGEYDDSLGYFNRDWLEEGASLGSYSSTGTWNLSDFVDTSTGRISAGTWFYPNGSNAHDALDWATPVGANLYAPSDIVVLKANDSCAHSDSGANWNRECNNFVLYLMQNSDGNVYSVKISHMQQGSITASGWIQSGGTVGKGTVIGKTGNSGHSEGPHAHFRINKLGQGDIAQFVNQYYATNDESFGTKWIPIPFSKRCESMNVTPCVEAPDVLFTGKHY